MTRHQQTVAILRALRHGATLADLQTAVGLSRASAYRALADLQQLGIIITRRPPGRAADSAAPYQVADWGIINPDKL
jgi:DNA-binding transcriptional ArsR family regulator